MAHILGDMVQSVGVVLASTILFFRPKWVIIDPLISVSFMIIAFTFSIPVVKDIIRVLLDATPENLDLEDFERQISEIKFVKEIHDIHIWNMTFGKPNLTCHILCSENPEYVLKRVTIVCRKIGIYHSTV